MIAPWASKVFAKSLKTLSIRCKCTVHHASLLSRVQFFVSQWTEVHQAPLSMGFSRQEYWSGLPSPTAENLPNLGTEPLSPAFPALAGRFFTTAPPGVASSTSAVRNFRWGLGKINFKPGHFIWSKVWETLCVCVCVCVKISPYSCWE